VPGTDGAGDDCRGGCGSGQAGDVHELSGLSVRELVAEHQVDVSRDLIVVYDELDLPLGAIRIRQRGVRRGTTGWDPSWALWVRMNFCGFGWEFRPSAKVTDGVKFVFNAVPQGARKGSG